jgi:phosphomannomutase/phosphoglucomutase
LSQWGDRVGEDMKRLFGTDGIRGVVGELMTPVFGAEMGMAIGTFLNKGRVVIATDTRTTNMMMKNAVVSGLISTGIDVTDLGIAPTPALQFAVKHFKANMGVIITASHNPPKFNGIKCIDSDGTELPREKEIKIENIFFRKKYKKASWENIGKISNEKITDEYINAIKKQVNTNLIKKAGLKVVLDCANGAGCFTAPYLLESLGCKVITLNANPMGVPSHSSEPTPENLKDLVKTVKALDADVGIAHDGDADRAVFVDEKGNYIPGEKTLAFLAGEIVKEKRGGLVVTAVSSSSCVEDAVEKYGGKIEYTKVGSPIIARVMKKKNAVFGGEENGGLIFPKFQYCRDGGMAVAKVLEIMAKTRKNLSELIATVPTYFLYKTKIPCSEEKKENALKKFAEEMKKQKLKISTIDGVKIFFSKGWVLIRPSGTEPIYRIFAESKNFEDAKDMAEKGKNMIKKIVEKE